MEWTLNTPPQTPSHSLFPQVHAGATGCLEQTNSMGTEQYSIPTWIPQGHHNLEHKVIYTGISSSSIIILFNFWLLDQIWQYKTTTLILLASLLYFYTLLLCSLLIESSSFIFYTCFKENSNFRTCGIHHCPCFLFVATTTNTFVASTTLTFITSKLGLSPLSPAPQGGRGIAFLSIQIQETIDLKLKLKFRH